jgi:hypothetical protein
MRRGGRWLFWIVGLLAFVGGGVATKHALVVYSAFLADPACTASIGLDTPLRIGPTCVIYGGSITRTYSRSGSKRSVRHHIVVVSDSGALLDVRLQNEFWSQVFSRATPGSRAVVETVNGFPAFIATSTGSVTASGDPRAALFGACVVFLVGVVLLLLAIFWKRFPTLR